jgi:hypothetical protein
MHDGGNGVNKSTRGLELEDWQCEVPQKGLVGGEEKTESDQRRRIITAAVS